MNGKTVSDGVIASIKRAGERGNLVFINTARSYIGMPTQIYDLPLDGFVNSFGLEIFADGRFIHRNFMPRQAVRKIAQYALTHELKLFFEGEKRMDIHQENGTDFSVSTLEEAERVISEIQFCKVVLDPQMPEEHKIILSEGYQRISNELIAKEYDKTYGMKMLGELYGISRENMVAIGDSDPDIEMLSYAGIGVCMGNGTPNLKAMAKYITRSVREDGVAYAIDHILDENLVALEVQK